MSHTFPIFPAPMGEWLVEAYMWITLPLTALFFAMAALPLTRALTLRFLSFAEPAHPRSGICLRCSPLALRGGLRTTMRRLQLKAC